MSELLDIVGLEDVAKAAGMEAMSNLVFATQTHIQEEVKQKLHSTRQMYLDNLHAEPVDADTWAIILDPPAMWIEEGMPQHEMIDDLLKSDKARTTKKGSKVLSVPFEHKKGAAESTPAQKDLTDTIKSEMKKRGIQYGGLEKDAGGTPKLGLLHSFDINTGPMKTGMGPGQGAGPIGAPRQGPTGVPFLAGVRVYQKSYKDKKGKDHVKKSIVTFRTVSSEMKGTGRWMYPGFTAKHFLDEGAEWAQKEFENNIKDKLIISIARGI